jgi:apolipoprotein N-acyltransferase
LPANSGPSRAAFAGKPAPTVPSPAPSASVAYAILGAALFAALWLLSEWLRGMVFTGFPWLALGYSQTPPSPLAGYLPLIGVYGVGGLAAFVAALVAFLPSRRTTATRHWAPVAVVGLVLAVGMGLAGRAWTVPAGAPLQVALVQTNFEQSLKWDPERFAEVLQINLDLVREAFQASAGFAGESPAQESALAETSPASNFPGEPRARSSPGVPVPALVVLPETTVPTLLDRLPEGYLDWLARLGHEAGGDLVMGVFRRDEAGHIYNAAISLGSAPAQHYAKQHLVPFGEYSPPFFGWFYQLAQIPMSDQTRGAPDQPPMRFGDQRVALNICYEDLFGAELIRALPAATLMLNISNLAWYGDSLAQPQHLQIARVRALETGRPMLRSTNTGMTALVQPDGRVTGVLPEFERGVLRGEAQGYTGLTPYARWGDWPALGFALLILIAVFLRRIRGSGLARERSP